MPINRVSGNRREFNGRLRRGRPVWRGRGLDRRNRSRKSALATCPGKGECHRKASRSPAELEGEVKRELLNDGLDTRGDIVGLVPRGVIGERLGILVRDIIKGEIKKNAKKED